MKIINMREIGIFIFDAFLLAIGLFLSVSILNKSNFIDFLLINKTLLLILFLSNLLVLFKLRLYKKVWSYFSLQDIKVVFCACFINIVINYLAILFNFNFDELRNVLFLQQIFLFVFFIASRVFYKTLREYLNSKENKQASSIILIGAGGGAALMMNHLAQSSEWNVVGFLDDDPSKKGRTILGRPILGPISDLPHFCKKYQIGHALLCMPSSSVEDKARALKEAANCRGLQVFTVPSFEDLLFKKNPINLLKDVDLSSLLGRDQVELSDEELNCFVGEKVVFISGAGGSIGSELCRQIAKYNPKLILLFDISEFAIYSIEEYFSHHFPKAQIKLIVGDIKNPNRVNSVFSKYKPDLVFHAAAYKHVPLMESENITEALSNNVIGTINLAEIAVYHRVEKFILISTDKAVNPTNVMGATKRLAEIACLSISKMSQTKFVIVRFGNVLGSNGSVIPKFQEQIHRGGPITVTHPDIERYFMTIPEAVKLVLQAGSMGYDSEVFILDMGHPIKIVDLAKRMIELSGITEEEIQIQFTGLRPGEKLYEELMLEYEDAIPTRHKKLRISKGSRGDFVLTVQEIKDWITYHIELSDSDIKIELKKILPEYIPVSK
jgi:FlaA1/EpsC-like NDP-sugar epimerase